MQDLAKRRNFQRLHAPARKARLAGGGRQHELVACPGNPPLRVGEQPRADGRVFRWLLSGGDGETLVESVVAMRGGHEFDRTVLLPAYHVAIVAALGLRRAPSRDFCFLGVGGGCLPLHLAQYHPRCCMVGVDHDERMFELGRRYFGCAPGPRLKLHAVPAEAYLRRRSTPSWDAIVVDLSDASRDGVRGEDGALRSPPPSMCSTAALRRLRRRLRPGGAVVVNGCGEGSGLARLRAAFSSVFASGSGRRSERGGGAGSLAVALETAEGNLVLAAVLPSRGGERGCRPAGPDPNHWREEWLAACRDVGLVVRWL